MEENQLPTGLTPELYRQPSPLIPIIIGVGVLIALGIATFIFYTNDDLGDDSKRDESSGEQLLGNNIIECTNNIQIEFQKQLQEQTRNRSLCDDESKDEKERSACHQAVSDSRTQTAKQMGQWLEACKEAYKDGYLEEMSKSIQNFQQLGDDIEKGIYDADKSTGGPEPQKINESLVLVNDTLSSKHSLEIGDSALQWVEYRKAQVNTNGRISYRNVWERWEYAFSPTTLLGSTRKIEEVSAQTHEESQCDLSFKKAGSGYEISNKQGKLIAKINTVASIYPPLVTCDDNYIIYNITTAGGGEQYNEIFVYDFVSAKNVFNKKVPYDEKEGTSRATWGKTVNDSLYYLIRGDSKIYHLNLQTLSEVVVVENPRMQDIDVNDSYIVYTVPKGDILTEFLYLQKLK